MLQPHLAYARTARAALRGGPLLAAALTKNAIDLQRASDGWPEASADYYAAHERGRGIWTLVSAIARDPDFGLPPEGQAELAGKAAAMLHRFMLVAEQPAEPALGEILAASRALARALEP
jgi:hypothetical protein